MPTAQAVLKRIIPLSFKWLTFAIALLPIVPYNINSMTMIAWAFVSLCYCISQSPEDRKVSKQEWLYFGIFSGNYLLLAMSLLYSPDKKEGAEALVGLLPMILFPCAFFVLHGRRLLSSKDIQTTLLVFWGATFALSLWLLVNYYRLGLFDQFEKADSFNNQFRLVSERLSGIHPTYLSVYFGFSLFLAGSFLIRIRHWLFRMLFIASLVVFTFHIFSLASRTPILSIFIAFFIIALFRIKSIIKRIIAVVLLTGCTLFIVRFTPAIYSRLIEARETAINVPLGDQYNSTNIRVGILTCSWNLIEKNMLWGTGIGSEKRELNRCYSNFTTDAYEKTYYNTHNQYFFFWLSGGILSIILFLFSVTYPIVFSLKKKNYFILCLAIMMMLAFLTENILSRHAGVVFYYFFLSLMTAGLVPIKPDSTTN